MKRNRASFFIILSLLVHLSLALGLYHWLRNQNPVTPQFVSFSFDEMAANTLSTKTTSAPPKEHSRKRKIDFAKLSPVLKISPSAEQSGSVSGADAGFVSGAQLTANSETLQDSFKDYPIVKALYERIDQNFSYAGTEVSRMQIQGSMNLTLKVHPSGKVEILESSPAHPQQLTGFILDQIMKALEKPLDGIVIEKSVVIYLHVDLNQFTDESMVLTERTNIYGHQVNIFKYANKPKIVQLNELSANGDPSMGIGFSVNVLAVWKLLFGSEKPAHRIEWDIEYRRQEFVRACEAQSAEGGCYKAGLIEKALGHHQEARRLIQRACELHLEEACRWIVQNG